MVGKLVAVFLYLAVMVGIGLVSARRTRTVGEFFLANRNIGAWMSAFAYGTTYFSAVIFIGYAGKIGWQFGLADLWIVAGNALVGSLLAWLVLARRTRELTTRLETMTMPEFLAARYASQGLKIAAALIVFIFLVPYSASVYMGLSYLFENVLGIPYVTALLLMTFITGFYLVLGGYLAINLTDFLQGIIMLVGVALLLFFGLTHPAVGGVSEGIRRLAAIDPRLVSPVGPPGWLPMAALVFLTSVGAWGLPQMTQKFYAVKSGEAAKRATLIASIFALIITFGAYFMGAFGRLYLNNQLPLAGGKVNFDLIMPQVLSSLPQPVLILMLLLILSASMSTLASLVLVSSSAVAIDLVQGWLAPRLPKEKLVFILRCLCGVFILLSLFLALRKFTLIIALMTLSWGAVAGAFLGPYLYGLFWPRATRAGAWAGMLGGLATAVGAAIYYHLDPALMPLLGSVAMLVSLAVVPLVSWVTQPLPVEHLARVYGEEIRRRGRGVEEEVAISSN